MSTIGDIEADLLAYVGECMADTPRGTPTEVFLGHAPGVPRGCCDYLQVYIQSIGWVAPFPRPQSLPLSGCITSLSRSVTYVIRFRRNCYPRLDNSGQFPPAADLTNATDDLNDDIEQVMCCLLAGYSAGEALQLPGSGGMALDVIFGQATPYRQADCAGWDWPLTVDVPKCCVITGS